MSGIDSYPGVGDAVLIGGVPVSTTAPTNGQLLAYDSGTGKWTPTTDAGASLPDPVTIAHGGTGSTTPAINGVGSVASAATGTITAIASDSYPLNSEFSITDALGFTRVFRHVSSAGTTGIDVATGKYFVACIGGGVNAAFVALIYRSVFNGVNYGVGGPFDLTGLDITSSVVTGSTITLTDGTTGAAGNVTITQTVNTAGFSVTGMSGGITGASSALTIGASTTAGKAVTSIGIGRNGVPVTIDGTLTVTNAVPITSGGSGSATASGARTNLGLAIGTNVQAWDVDLDAIAALAATGGMLSRTGAGAFTVRTIAGATGVSVANGDGVAGNPSLTLTANGVTAAALSVSALRFLGALGLASAGAVTLTGAKVTDQVVGVVDVTTGGTATSNFESAITVNNQIQQSGGVLTAHVLVVLLVAKGG